MIRPVAGSRVSSGSEAPTVNVTSAGLTATPFSVSLARTELVTPPSVPLMVEKVSGSASISGALMTTVSVMLAQLSGFKVSQIVYSTV